MTFSKSSKNKHEYFTQLFSRITIIVLAAVVILAVTLYIFSSFAVLNVLYKSNLEVFSQISYTANYLNEQIKSNIASISSDEKTTALTRSSPASIIEINNAYNQIKYITNSNPLIYSVYIYNGYNNTYYITGKNSHVRQSSFYDKEISDILRNLTNYDISEPIARTIPENELNTDEKINVFTYVLPESYYNNEKYKSAVVINVKVDDYLKRLSPDIERKPYGQMSLLNKKGIVIGHQSGDKFLTDVSSEKYTKQILSSKTNSDYFVAELDNTKSIISYIYLNSPDWILVNATPYKYISSSINFFRITIILIALLILFLAILFSYIMSKRLYVPISNILNKIHKLKPVLNGDDFQTLNNVSQSIDNITNELNLLDSFRRNNEFLIKNENLKKFLYNSTKENYLSANFNFIGNEDTLASKYLICIYKIDRFDDFTSDLTYSDQFLYKYAFVNIAQEITSRQFLCEFIDVNSDHIISIINITNKTSVFSEIKKLVIEIQEAYLKYFDISISAFISNGIKNLSDITSAYKITYEMSFYRIIYGHGSIITQKEFDNTHFVTNIIPYEKIKPILDMINLTRQDDALEYLHNFIEILKQYEYSNLMASVAILSTSIFNALSNQDGIKNKLQLSYATFTNEISKLETLTQIEKSFADVITYICENKQIARNNKTDNTISNIITYIENNYTDINISSKTIADVVKLSPRYVSKLFYEHTEQTIQSYINEYRINIAKDMLKNTESTIEEILTRIGWPNLKHFYTVFKKHTGLTPSEFRKSSSANITTTT